MENLDRRGFLKKAAGAAAAMAVGSEALAQGESSERVTLSRLEFNALHFGIIPHQLQRLIAAGARFDGNDRRMNIELWGNRLILSEADKVISIGFASSAKADVASVHFTLADDTSVRRFVFERQ